MAPQTAGTASCSKYGTRVRSATVSFVPRSFIAPLKLSTGLIEEITEAQVTVEVELPRQGISAVGHGTIFLSDLWAWPTELLDHSYRDRSLRTVCEQVAAQLPALFGSESLHPTEIGLRLHEWVCHALSVDVDPPLLARAMCCSPFDAAIHDAVGQALRISAFRFYDNADAIPSADGFFPRGGASQAIQRMLQTPRASFPAWLLVATSDNAYSTIEHAVRARGYYCFKIKIGGKDNCSDVARTVEVFQAARRLGVDRPRMTVDSNEANPDAASVLEYLNRLASTDRDAFDALEYLEQPTGRDIRQQAYDWHEVTKWKPVFLDEGLTDLSCLEMGLSQGWTGLALKTCKGHSMLLATAAWAHDHAMPISLQDLTNPGISLIHAALVAAHLPTVNGAELNSPQFTPIANADFLPRLESLFEPRGGFHTLPEVSPIGLGTRL